MTSLIAATLLLAAAPAASPTPAAAAHIEDDYARAVAEAKARNVPLVVDVWAPW